MLLLDKWRGKKLMANDERERDGSMGHVSTVCCLYFPESDTNKCHRDAE